MSKSFSVNGVIFDQGALIHKDDLNHLENEGFIKSLDCTSSKHICYAAGYKNIILEILGETSDAAEKFKVYKINY